MKEVVKDKYGRTVQFGDRVRFDLYDGVPNVEMTVVENEDAPGGYTPGTIKYLSFEIVTEKKDDMDSRFPGHTQASKNAGRFLGVDFPYVPGDPEF